ncbi:unnamed protein product, partial [Cyprideis torosa]
MGDMVYFERMAGALPVSVDVAMKKAYSSAAVRVPTHVIADFTQPGQSLYGLQTSDKGRIVNFGGGFPLEWEGDCVGAVGVSGGEVAQDIAVAQAAVDGFADMEEMAAALRENLPSPIQDYETFIQQAKSLDVLGTIS